MNTGKAIRKALIDADKTQTWLADELGVTRQATSYLCNQSSIQTELVERIAEILGLSVIELLKMGVENE